MPREGIRDCMAGNNPGLEALELRLAQFLPAAGSGALSLSRHLEQSVPAAEFVGLLPLPCLPLFWHPLSFGLFHPRLTHRASFFGVANEPGIHLPALRCAALRNKRKTSTGGRTGSRARRRALVTIFFWRQPMTWTSTSESYECSTVENARPTAPVL